MIVNFLKIGIVVMAAVGVSACGDKDIPAKLALPLTISCDKSTPASWEDGDVFNLLESGTASLSTKFLTSRGIVSMVGKWKRIDERYAITWNGSVTTEGKLIASPPKAHGIFKLIASDNKNTVEMRLPTESRYCLVGG